MSGMKPVSFKVDGQAISAVLHMPPGRKKKPAVLLCHGFAGNRMEAHFIMVKLSRELEKHGIASLRFDFRGSGESEGAFKDMTILTEIKDAKRALGVLARTIGIDADRIGLLGLSLGGCVAACVSPDKRVKSLALWAAVGDLKARLEERMTQPMKLALKLTKYVDIGGLKAGTGFYAAAGKVDALGSVGKCRAPILIVHGSADETVSVDHSKDYYEAARKRKIPTRLKIIRKGGHTFANVKHEKRVIETTAKWFSETL